MKYVASFLFGCFLYLCGRVAYIKAFQETTVISDCYDQEGDPAKAQALALADTWKQATVFCKGKTFRLDVQELGLCGVLHYKGWFSRMEVVCH